MEKYVPLNKQSKRKQKEHRNKNRMMFGHINCSVAHKSAKDYNRKKEKENLKSMLID